MYSLFPSSPFAVVRGTPVLFPFCSLRVFGVLLPWCPPKCKRRAQAPYASTLGWHGSRESRTLTFMLHTHLAWAARTMVVVVVVVAAAAAAAWVGGWVSEWVSE